ENLKNEDRSEEKEVQSENLPEVDTTEVKRPENEDEKDAEDIIEPKEVSESQETAEIFVNPKVTKEEVEEVKKQVRFELIDEDKNTDDNRQDFGLDISVGEIVKNVFDDQGETAEKHKIDDIYENFPSSQISGKEFFAQYEKKESDTYSVVTEDITDDENDKKKSENDFQKKEDITKTVEGDGMKEEMKEIKEEMKDDCKDVIQNESKEKDQSHQKGEDERSDE
ncbi:MAG: hypothetical protein MJE68_32920, partial [Proteobacteria bacterium]|nr:hypothetical protein [Pseudomonadota bacterium]